MSNRLLSVKYGPLYIQFNPDATVLLTRDDRPMSLLLSLSEYNWFILCAQLHGWPIAPPLQGVPDYSLIVEPWKDAEQT